MTVYIDMYNTNEWDALANMAKAAAHDLFAYYIPGGSCSDALDEQDAIQRAFDAIGASGSNPSWRDCSFCGGC